MEGGVIKTFGKDIIIGGASAAICKTVIAPVETISTLLHLNGVFGGKFNGWGDCFQQTIKEGFRYLWKGNLGDIKTYAPMMAFSFAFKEYFVHLLNFNKEKDGNMNWMMGNFISGSLAGFSSICVLYSIYAPFTSSSIKSKGFFVNSVGVIIYRGIHFGLYDSFKPLINDHFNNNNINLNNNNNNINKTNNDNKNNNDLINNIKNTTSLFTLGFISTTAAGFLTHPFDEIRRRTYSYSPKSDPNSFPEFKNSIDAFFKILKNEGIKPLFRGVSNYRILRSFTGAAVLVSFDKLRFLVNGK